MKPLLLQRQFALGAAALVAAVVGLAIGGHESSTSRPRSGLPQPAGDVSSWYRALAGVRVRRLQGTSACGLALTPVSLGVIHPVLPCNAKIFVAYRGKMLLTQVIDRGPVPAGREFDLTRALADRIGLDGVQQVRWTFARPA